MSQIRQDQATKRWVVIATERAKRPHDLAARETPETGEKQYSPDYPFCPGNESMTPPEVYAFREQGDAANGPGWQVRVVPNLFAAVSPEGEPEIQQPYYFTSVTGVGAHEVLIENSLHNADLATMNVGEVTRFLMAAVDRFDALQGDRRLSYIALFRNHGLAAGTSLTHPHSQIVATPIAPTSVRDEIEEARRHYDDRLHCVYCEVMHHEVDGDERIVLETDSYLVFEPFASRWPFETWVVPKRHSAAFALRDASEIRPLASALRTTLSALHHALGNPAYNLGLHAAPLRDSCEDYYHWHLEILPRLSTPAGFELGTGIWINTLLPEHSAEYLRDFVTA